MLFAAILKSSRPVRPPSSHRWRRPHARLRRRQAAALHDPRGPSPAWTIRWRFNPGLVGRRGLHGRPADDRGGHALRLPGDRRPQLRPSPAQRLVRAGEYGRAKAEAVPIPSAAPAATSPTTTTCADQLYDLFLDRDRQYSCAYFAAKSDSLETAQENKKRHIASKLLLDRQRLRVLDIGSGWGELALSGPGSRRRRHRRHAQHRAAQGEPRRAPPDRRPRRARALPPARLPRGARPLRPRRPPSACSSMWACRTTARFFQRGEGICWPMTASPCCIRSAPWSRRAARKPMAAENTSSPVAHTPALSEGDGEAVQAVGLWGGRRWRSSRLHYAKRCGPGASASRPTATRVRALYDERFCRMSVLSRDASSAFRYGGQMASSRCSWPSSPDVVPLTRDYMVVGNAPTWRAAARACARCADQPPTAPPARRSRARAGGRRRPRP